EPRRDREQRVEPPARLVEPLGDEVARIARRERVPMLERIVPLREWNEPRVEPGVDHRGRATHCSAAARLPARPRMLVDVRLVRIEVARERSAGALPETGVAAQNAQMVPTGARD